MSDDTTTNTDTEEREPGSTRADARNPGDLTSQWITAPGGLGSVEETVGRAGDGIDYYRFILSVSRHA